MSLWSVYLLRCSDDTLYCGVTTNVQRRLAMHNGVLPGGAKYTRGRRSVKLLISVNGLERGAALKLEHEVKKLPRAEKLDALMQHEHRDPEE